MVVTAAFSGRGATVFKPILHSQNAGPLEGSRQSVCSCSPRISNCFCQCCSRPFQQRPARRRPRPVSSMFSFFSSSPTTYDVGGILHKPVVGAAWNRKIPPGLRESEIEAIRAAGFRGPRLSMGRFFQQLTKVERSPGREGPVACPGHTISTLSGRPSEKAALSVSLAAFFSLGRPVAPSAPTGWLEQQAFRAQ